MNNNSFFILSVIKSYKIIFDVEQVLPMKANYIHFIIQYIEKHLSDEINPENIAKQHFISISQLYRDFYSYTGHSIKEYIRKRRISNACEKLKCSGIPLSVIAAQSRCETQQSF